MKKQYFSSRFFSVQGMIILHRIVTPALSLFHCARNGTGRGPRTLQNHPDLPSCNTFSRMPSYSKYLSAIFEKRWNSALFTYFILCCPLKKLTNSYIIVGIVIGLISVWSESQRYSGYFCFYHVWCIVGIVIRIKEISQCCRTAVQ